MAKAETARAVRQAIDEPPSRLALVAEMPRAGWTFVRFVLARHSLRVASRGDGRPILVIPGLFMSDARTRILRRTIASWGYSVYGWQLGTNLAMRTIGEDGERLHARIAELAEIHGTPLTVIGFSLGGVMARLAAQRWPELVREVITLCAPYAGSPRATNLWRLYQWLTGEQVDTPEARALLAECAMPLNVPATAIWSRNDGLVSGVICHDPADPTCRSIEISTSHVGAPINPKVLRVIAQVLEGSCCYGQN